MDFIISITNMFCKSEQKKERHREWKKPAIKKTNPTFAGISHVWQNQPNGTYEKATMKEKKVNEWKRKREKRDNEPEPVIEWFVSGVRTKCRVAFHRPNDIVKIMETNKIRFTPLVNCPLRRIGWGFFGHIFCHVFLVPIMPIIKMKCLKMNPWNSFDCSVCRLSSNQCNSMLYQLAQCKYIAPIGIV